METQLQSYKTNQSLVLKFTAWACVFLISLFCFFYWVDNAFISISLLLCPTIAGMLLFSKRKFTWLIGFTCAGLLYFFISGLPYSDLKPYIFIPIFLILGVQVVRQYQVKYDTLYEQSQSQIQRLSGLRQIDVSITNTRDIKDTLQIVIQQAISLPNVKYATIYLLADDKKVYSRIVGNQSANLETIPLLSHPARKAIEEKDTLFISVLPKKDNHLPGRFHQHNPGGFRFLVLPLYFDQEVLGTLEIEQTSGVPLDDSVLTYLETLAGQAAIAVKHAAAYTHLETMNHQLESTIRELSETKDVLEKSQRIGLIGSWRFKAKTQSVEWSKELLNIYGISPKNVVLSMDTLYHSMLPEDKTMVQQSMAQLFMGQNIPEIQYRICHADGSIRHLITKCEVFQDKRNQITEIIGTVRDRTDHKQAELDTYEAHINLQQAYETTLEGWARALDLRDHGTEGHAQRVTQISLLLAEILEIPKSEWIHIRRGALLHDIGKIGIPDTILLKPGSLSEDEWLIMKQHPQFAYDLLSPISYLLPALDIPYYHHEKWDGSGYPLGLKGKEIPLPARIFAVVDVLDALCSDRPYRKAWTLEQTREYLQQQAGIHFDPAIIEALLANWERITI